MSVPLNPNEEPSDKHSGEPVWMVVATATGVTEASIIAGRLQSLGIPTMIHREAVSSALPLSFGLGQASVVVPEKFYDVAMQILEPDTETPWLEDGEADDEEYFDDDAEDDEADL